MADYDFEWSEGETILFLGRGPVVSFKWSEGETILDWELAEGFIFSEVEMEGVVIG
jgi:hypothetical protein